ncbi:F-box/LRR-repeat protein 14 [Schistosoma japonicum]|nr:F-box/LRR-repeat protein 14 [Schistosoma japonicum]
MLRILRCLALKNSESVLPDAIKLCPFLTCLNIGFITLSEQGATILVNNLPPTLLHLNVEGINNIEIDFITTLVHRCPKLEALNLSHCVSVCDTCVKIISDELHSLRRLNLDGVLWITDSGLLHLADSKAVHNGSLNSIWLDGFELSNSGLNEFIIRLDYATKRLSGDVDDIIYSETGHHVFGIQQLWISFCDHIEDEAIKSIANLSTLVALTLRKTHQVTPVGLSSLFITSFNHLDHQLNLRYLEHLDLSEAPGLNDSVVMDICNCCGNRLRFLTLNWCWEVTDIGVNQIIEVCNSLHQLSLIGNSTIQGRAFSEIPLKVPHLIILNLTQCNHIVDNVLEDLAVKMPNLYVFDFFGERVGGELDDICHFDVSRALGKVPICTD